MKLRFTVASVIGLAAAGCTRDDHELVKVRSESKSNVVVASKAANAQELANDEQGQIADGPGDGLRQHGREP